MQNILREDLSNVQNVGKKYPKILAAWNQNLKYLLNSSIIAENIFWGIYQRAKGLWQKSMYFWAA